jgi:hypothetical protein
LIETKNALSAKILFINQNTWKKNSGNNDWEWKIERKCHSIQLDIFSFSICVLFCFSKTFIYFKNRYEFIESIYLKVLNSFLNDLNIKLRLFRFTKFWNIIRKLNETNIKSNHGRI